MFQHGDANVIDSRSLNYFSLIMRVSVKLKHDCINSMLLLHIVTVALLHKIFSIKVCKMGLTTSKKSKFPKIC